MCVLTHENQVVMQMTSQFLSFPSTQPLKYLVFTMSATTRSYEKSEWTRVRFPTRRVVFVSGSMLPFSEVDWILEESLIEKWISEHDPYPYTRKNSHSLRS